MVVRGAPLGMDRAVEEVGPTCRLCRSTWGQVVLDLGVQPPCDVFPPRDSDVVEELCPLRMWLCGACGLAQLIEDPGGVEEHVVVVEPQAMADQARLVLETLGRAGVVRPGLRVAEHGSPHSVSWRSRFEGVGLRPVDPGEDLDLDIVFDVYGLLHEPDQAAALAERARALGPDGALVVQMHSICAAVADRNWAELRHGHYAYWSLPALADALRRVGLGVHRTWTFPLDGGTTVVLATRSPQPDATVRRALADERAAGSHDAGSLGRLQSDADVTAVRLRDWLRAQRAQGRRVVGYGAASRAVPVLCHAGIDRSLLAEVGDASPAKQGRRMPGTDVPVVSPAQLLSGRPDIVLVFLPDLLGELRRTMPELEAAGGRWVSLGVVDDPAAEPAPQTC